MIKQIIQKLYEYFYAIEIEEQKDYIQELETSIKALQEETNIVEPKAYGTININDVYKMFLGKCPTYISDENLNLTTKEEAMKFSEETKVQYRTWVAENHDCDNFSFALMGYWSQGLKSFAFGVAWSDVHAFNIMIDKDKQIWIIEPQSNEYMKFEDAQKNKIYYPLRMVIM